MSCNLYLDLMIQGAVAHRFALAPGQQTLGRDRGCAIRLLDTSVSGIHCLLDVAAATRLPGHFEVGVSDLGSTNGTTVNGTRVQQARLVIGDRLGCGDVSLVLSGADGITTTQTAISLGAGGA